MNLAERTGPTAWRHIEHSRRAHTRASAFFWTRNINHRLAAALALRLEPTGVTPNTVSIVSVSIYLPVSVYIWALRPPAPILGSIGVFLAIQVAYTLDCTDGLLARLRGQSSAFGGWLDRVFDFSGHVLLLVSLLVYVTRALHLDAPTAALLTGLVLGAHLTQMFASFYRTAVLGSAPAERGEASPAVRALKGFMQVTDYGLVVALLAAGLAYPPALAGVLVAYAVLVTGMLAGQIVLNWPAAGEVA